MSSKLSQLGEFGIIGMFQKANGVDRDWTVAGIGDDCAVLAAGGDERLLVTTDMLVERVHFLRAGISPWQLGYKAMAVNLSDIAAMGAEPTAAFLALGLTRSSTTEFVAGFRDGLLQCAEEYRVDLLGGDTVSSKADLIVCLSLLGRALASEVVMRKGACVGDGVFLGRPVGASAAGLYLVLGGEGELDDSDREKLMEAHLTPRPQVELGRLLGTLGFASAMIDVSDGVFQDLGHLCEAGGVGAEVEADLLPVPEPAKRLAAAIGRNAGEWALSGGEDYCLLFCVPNSREDECVRACRAELGLEVTRIGRIVPGGTPRARLGGRWIDGSPGGFDHFDPASEDE